MSAEIWGLLAGMTGAIGVLFAALLSTWNTAAKRHLEELARIQKDADRNQAAVEKWQKVYEESIRAGAEQSQALRELSKAVDRQTVATNQSATEEAATREVLRRVTSGSYRAIRPPDPGADR